jgi:hypothetical protein
VPSGSNALVWPATAPTTVAVTTISPAPTFDIALPAMSPRAGDVVPTTVSVEIDRGIDCVGPGEVAGAAAVVAVATVDRVPQVFVTFPCT